MRFFYTIAVVYLLAWPGNLLSQGWSEEDVDLAKDYVGFSFLRVDLTGYGAALGGACVASITGAEALFWNPGGAPCVDGIDVVIGYAPHLFSSLGYVGLTTAWGKNAFGITLVNFYVPKMEFHLDYPSSPLGYYDAGAFSIALGLARQIDPRLSFGISGKWIRERIYISSYNIWALDIGAQLSLPYGLRVGAAVQHWGTSYGWGSTRIYSPLCIKGGASWEYGLGDVGVGVSGEVNYYEDVGFVFPVGFEFLYAGMYTLRAGMKINHPTEIFSVGVGIRKESIAVDYAVLFYSAGFGFTHRLGLNFRL